MALTAPILVMLSFGTIEYSYFAYVKSETLSAANCGAQEASLATSTNTTVQSAVSQAMQSSNLQNTGYTVTTSPSSVSGLASGTSISVTVTFPWSVMNFNPLPPALGGISTNKQVTVVAPTRRQ